MARTDLLPLLSLLSPAICAPVLAQAPAPSFPSEVLFPPYTSSSSADELANGGLAVGSSFVAATAPQRASEGVALIWPRAGAAFGAPELVLSPQTTTSNRFGQALDFNGDELAISELRSGLFGNLGAVHLYERVAGQWQRTESLADPGGVFILSFGDSLGFDGDTVVAGSPSAFVQGQSRGAVYVFRRTGGAFALEATLTASNGALGDRFGDDVAVSGDRLVASAPGHGATGAAYVFERSGGAWSEVAVLGLPAGSSDDGFGSDVDVDGTTVAVGAQTGNDVGTVHVFVESAGVWTLEQRIQPGGLTVFARFGSAVDLAGDRLAVGAPGDSATGFGLGSSWSFQRTGGVWAARARLVQSLDTPAGLFGTSVVTDGAGTVITAAPRNVTPSAGNYGALFVHTPEPEIGDAYCAAKTNSSGQVGGAAARGSRVASANDVTLVAFDLPAQQFGFFLASRTEGFVANLGGSEGNLCLGGALGRLVGPGQIQSSGTARQISIDLDLTAIPQPSSLETAVAGETWRFQAWHRDTVGGTATSNFTAGVAVSFL